MLKDKEVIERTLKQKKFERAKLSFRVYQVFKLIRREFYQEVNFHPKDDKTLRPVTKRFIVEAF